MQSKKDMQKCLKKYKIKKIIPQIPLMTNSHIKPKDEKTIIHSEESCLSRGVLIPLTHYKDSILKQQITLHIWKTLHILLLHFTHPQQSLIHTLQEIQHTQRSSLSSSLAGWWLEKTRGGVTSRPAHCTAGRGERCHGVTIIFISRHTSAALTLSVWFFSLY